MLRLLRLLWRHSVWVFTWRCAGCTLTPSLMQVNAILMEFGLAAHHPISSHFFIHQGLYPRSPAARLVDLSREHQPAILTTPGRQRIGLVVCKCDMASGLSSFSAICCCHCPVPVPRCPRQNGSKPMPLRLGGRRETVSGQDARVLRRASS